MKAIFVIIVKLVLFIAIPKHNFHRVNGQTAVPSEHMDLMQEQYEQFMQSHKNKNHKNGQASGKKANAFSANEKPIQIFNRTQFLETLKDTPEKIVPPTLQVVIPPGKFWFGTQMGFGTKENNGKIVPLERKDGADIRKKVTITKPFTMDIHTVTRKQFEFFVEATGYVTEAEQYGWSFVLESLATKEVADMVDGKIPGKTAYGRVKNAQHWLGVEGADWRHPYGDSRLDTVDADLSLPVVHVSFRDAATYCAWLGLELPAEKRWEYAARGGRVNQSYPWGDEEYTEQTFPRLMNIWEGKNMKKKSNLLLDGYLGLAPVTAFPPNAYGLFNMVGNVWEWVAGMPPQPPPQKDSRPQRILRGGSFIDTADGQLNHAVRVSTRQLNGEDSAGSNVGFRCCCGKEEDAVDVDFAAQQQYQVRADRRRRTVWEEQDL